VSIPRKEIKASDLRPISRRDPTRPRSPSFCPRQPIWPASHATQTRYFAPRTTKTAVFNIAQTHLVCADRVCGCGCSGFAANVISGFPAAPNCRFQLPFSHRTLSGIWARIHATNRLASDCLTGRRKSCVVTNIGRLGDVICFRVSPLVVALAATTMLTSAALAAEQTGKASATDAVKPSVATQTANQDLGKLSADGFKAFRDVRLARLPPVPM